MAEPVAPQPPVETDYSNLIIADATPAEAPPDPVAEQPAQEPKAESPVKASDTAPDVTDTTPDPKPVEAPKPGTPDVWRQKVDQRMAEIERLVAKKDDGTISPKEEARLEQKKDELAEILERGEAIDPVTTKRVLDVDKRSSDDVKAIREEMEQLRNQVREAERRETWRAEREKYPGVDVEKTVWPNAAKDATEEVRKEIELSGMDFDEATISKMCYARTRTLYEKRAAEAAKSLEARTSATPPKTAPRTPSKTTPNGARVMVQGSSSGVSKPGNVNEITDADYGNLIAKD